MDQLLYVCIEKQMKQNKEIEVGLKAYKKECLLERLLDRRLFLADKSTY